MADLLASGYDGFIAIEPHIGKVFHVSEEEQASNPNREYDLYLEYGQRFEKLVASV